MISPKRKTGIENFYPQSSYEEPEHEGSGRRFAMVRKFGGALLRRFRRLSEPTIERVDLFESEALPLQEDGPRVESNSPEELPASEESDILKDGYAKEAPDLRSQVEDETRQNVFSYARTRTRLDNRDPEQGDEIVTMTEHEGLLELSRFLDSISEDVVGSDLAQSAKAILDNLTFIGEKEHTEAEEGLKELWKTYLDENPDLQLCIFAGVSQSNNKRKSDEYLIERILAHFTDDEKRMYDGRIVARLEEITRQPENTKIILVDDWTMSGAQLRQAADLVIENESYSKYADCLEVNLIAASSARIEGGLKDPVRGSDFSIPVKAYFKTHKETTKSSYFLRGETPVTGTHSSGDYGFEQIIDRIVSALNEKGASTTMPPLTNVIRQYRYR